MTTPLRTLILEDSEDDAALLLLELERGGFDPTHERVDTAKAMSAALEGQTWDVILADYKMPHFNALNALSILKEKRQDIPFIIVTGSIGEETATAAMRAGANDYLMKDNLTRLNETVRRELKEAVNRAALRSAEASLRESEEKYRRFFEEDLSADFISTPDGEILVCNPSFVRLFGFSSTEEAASHDLKSLFPDRAAWDRFIDALRQKRKLQWCEVELRCPDGARVDAIANVVGRFDPENKLIEFKGYLFDNTERKALERQLFQVRKMESLGRLASGIAHDFNNVLTGILGYTDLSLLKIDETHPLHSYLTHIRQLVWKASKMIRQLLVFGRRQVIEPTPLNLNTVLLELLPLLEKVLSEEIEMTFHPDPHLKNVHADLSQIEQVILNLCVNARDAMPEGGRLILQTKNLSSTEPDIPETPFIHPGDYVLLSVSDTGVGMDEKTIERIFDPFFSTKDPDHGTGLGLSIVHGIVGQHGGWVTVESRIGKGSTFKIFLPAVEKSAHAAPGREFTRHLPRRSEKILIVEDDPLLRTVFQRSLEERGHSVLLAENGEEGLRQIKQQTDPVPVVISDLVMPKMNGREFYERVQMIKPGTKFLFVSGYTDLPAHQEWLKKNTPPLLLKPFSPSELVAKVHDLLEPPTDAAKPEAA
ncbi:MAG: response regulator [Candidatus Manganitrophus sp. SB1]|nr:response regulator [Candidatus Manganitrophus morganii]